MRRNTAGLIVAVALWMLWAPFASDAQMAPRVPRVGMLMPLSTEAAAENLEVFRQGLRERGYVEGQNIAIEYRFSAGKDERLLDLAADLVRRPVDVMVTQGTPATLAAKKATLTIPIVMAAIIDPVGTGIVQSLGRPGGNVTGLTSGTAELSGKSLQLLKELVPGVGRIAVLLNPTNPVMQLTLSETQAAGRALGVQLQPFRASDPKELESAFRAMTRERPGALLVLQDLALHVHRKRIVDLAAKIRIPAMYERRQWVEAGGLISYGVNFLDNYRRAAGYVDRILKGAKPAELPVEQPTKFEMVVNLKVAKTLGLTIPPSLLLQADQLIE